MIRKLTPSPKILLIFDLHSVLGYVQKAGQSKAQSSQHIIPKSKLNEIKADVTLEGGSSIFFRPELTLLITHIMLDLRGQVDVGIWSSQNLANTEEQARAFFGRYVAYLRFIEYNRENTPHRNRGALAGGLSTNVLKPMPMSRNLDGLFDKYKMNDQYSKQNTILFTNYPNLNENYLLNDGIIPVFDPIHTPDSTTYLHNDDTLDYLYKYIDVLLMKRKREAINLYTKQLQITYMRIYNAQYGTLYIYIYI